MFSLKIHLPLLKNEVLVKTWKIWMDVGQWDWGRENDIYSVCLVSCKLSCSDSKAGTVSMMGGSKPWSVGETQTTTSFCE